MLHPPDDCMVEVHDVADFDHAVWLPWWRRAKVRAYTAKKSKKKVCSDYLFENSCKGHIAQYDQVYTLMDSLEKSVSTSARQNRC